MGTYEDLESSFEGRFHMEVPAQVDLSPVLGSNTLIQQCEVGVKNIQGSLTCTPDKERVN